MMSTRQTEGYGLRRETEDSRATMKIGISESEGKDPIQIRCP